MGSRVAKTRNAGTLSEAAYWGFIRSALRRAFRFWKPIQQAKMEARRGVTGRGNQKWDYLCAKCGGWFKGKDVQVDHIVPVGSLRSYEDLAGFVQRLSAEKGYQVLCSTCHGEKTQKERKVAKETRDVL